MKKLALAVLVYISLLFMPQAAPECLIAGMDFREKTLPSFSAVPKETNPVPFNSEKTRKTEPSIPEVIPTEPQVVSTKQPEKVSETEPTFSYQEVNETVYATTGVNIRSGPGTEYSILDLLSFGSAITRIGIGSNGWSEVLYQGETAYIASEYLTTEEPAPVGPLGTAGRLTIPSVGIDVALYACSSRSEYAIEQQQIVDAADSAAYLDPTYIDGHIVADHQNQGFSALNDCIPYETYAYIYTASSTQRYICIGVGSGQNLGNDLLDWNGTSLNYGAITGGLAMYTCNQDSVHVTITYWEPA